MEPAQGPIARYKLTERVMGIYRDPMERWFIHLEGSHESLFVGMEEPKHRIGAIAIITIDIPIQE